MNAKKNNPSNIDSESRDVNGNLCIPSYRGVWVNSEGKYIVKVDGEVLKRSNQMADMLFDEADDAAKHYDYIMKLRDENLELNFKPDGTRIKYDNSGLMSARRRGLDVIGMYSGKCYAVLFNLLLY